MLPIPSSLCVVLLAGGQGSRMATTTPKQFLSLGSKPVALHSFDLFASLVDRDQIIVVCETEYQSFFPSHTRFALPGKRRQDSVFNALQKISPATDFVCIHDSARPLLDKEHLIAVLQAAEHYGAASLAVPVKNTIKECDSDRFITRSPDRSKLWEMHTPQVFKTELLRQGYRLALEQNADVTDDCSIVELTHHPIKLVNDSYHNIKLTTPDDWAIAESHLNSRSGR